MTRPQQSNQGFSRRCAKLRFSGGQSPKCSDGNRAAQPTTQPSAYMRTSPLCPLPSAFGAQRDNSPFPHIATHHLTQGLKSKPDPAIIILNLTSETKEVA